MIDAISVLLWAAATSASVDVPKNADVSVIGIHLDDPASTEAVLGADISWEEVVLPRAYFVNASGTEELEVTFHNGNFKNAISEFLVSTPPRRGMKAKVLKSITAFTTGKGVRLGMGTAELTRLLGEPAKTEKSNTAVTLRYHITDLSTSPFLQRYNMPSYYGTYRFKGGKLVEYGFGFESP